MSRYLKTTLITLAFVVGTATQSLAYKEGGCIKIEPVKTHGIVKTLASYPVDKEMLIQSPYYPSNPVEADIRYAKYSPICEDALGGTDICRIDPFI